MAASDKISEDFGAASEVELDRYDSSYTPSSEVTPVQEQYQSSAQGTPVTTQTATNSSGSIFDGLDDFYQQQTPKRSDAELRAIINGLIDEAGLRFDSDIREMAIQACIKYMRERGM